LARAARPVERAPGPQRRSLWSPRASEARRPAQAARPVEHAPGPQRRPSWIPRARWTPGARLGPPGPWSARQGRCGAHHGSLARSMADGSRAFLRRHPLGPVEHARRLSLAPFPRPRGAHAAPFRAPADEWQRRLSLAPFPRPREHARRLSLAPFPRHRGARAAPFSGAIPPAPWSTRGAFPRALANGSGAILRRHSPGPWSTRARSRSGAHRGALARRTPSVRLGPWSAPGPQRRSPWSPRARRTPSRSARAGRACGARPEAAAVPTVAPSRGGCSAARLGCRVRPVERARRERDLGACRRIISGEESGSRRL
jgi:hypothetical protein